MRQGMTEEEVARNCPPDVPPHQWMELVHYWFSERAQVYYLFIIFFSKYFIKILIFIIYCIYNKFFTLFYRLILLLVELHEQLSLFLIHRGRRVMHDSDRSLYVL